MKLKLLIMLSCVVLALIWFLSRMRTPLLSGAVYADTVDQTVRKSDGQIQSGEAHHREYKPATPVETEPEIIFQQDTNEYNTTRIPALVYYQDTFFAFAEGRRETWYDIGAMDIILRRGKRKDWKVEWGPIQVVAKLNGYRMMDPVPIVDSTIGAILLVCNAHPANMSAFEELTDGIMNTRLFITKSFDLGESWTELQELNDEVVEAIKPKPAQYGPGPGHGLHMKSGRLIVQGKIFQIKLQANKTIDFRNGASFVHSNVIYSDDHGKSWQPGGSLAYTTEINGRPIYNGESTVVELDNGRLCLNSRTLHPDQPRLIAFSNDNGESFDTPHLESSLEEPGYFLDKNQTKVPVFGDNFQPGPFLHENKSMHIIAGEAGGCQGSMISFPALYPNSPSNTWAVFSNPASAVLRKNMAVKLSQDGCQTWSKPWILHPNASAYSDMAYFETWDSNKGAYSPNVAILYEANVENPDFPYESIQFKMFNVERMMQGIQESSSSFSSGSNLFRGPKPKEASDPRKGVLNSIGIRKRRRTVETRCNKVTGEDRGIQALRL